MVEASERSYRWGRFQGWSFVVVGALIYLLTPWAPDWDFAMRITMYVAGAWQIIMGIGLVGRRRYGLVLFYVSAVLMAITALRRGFHPEGYLLMWWWIIPAVVYYPKRYREFGFGKQKQQAEMVVSVAEPENSAIPNRPLEDVEVQQVLEDIRKRREKRNTGF